MMEKDLFSDILFFVLGLSIILYTRSDISLVLVFIIIIPYLAFTKRAKLILNYLIAFLVTTIFIFLIRDNYSYNRDFYTVFGMNLFPLFAWTLGIFALYVIYHYIRKEKDSLSKRLGIFIVIYWPSLIILETAAYHLLDIHNLAASQYPGLPICNCIHAPLIVQILYFTIGLIYFFILQLLKLDK
jgi:hypothetical protein